MDQIGLEIALADGQTLHARPLPETERQLAEVLGDRTTVEFASPADDLEGHAISTDVFVDVEGHAMALRLPTAADAAALRRALAVGVVTATVVGAGAIAGLQAPPRSTTGIDQGATHEMPRVVPAQALRAQQAEILREQQFELVPGKVAPAKIAPLNAVPDDADNPAIPRQALRAQQADMEREQQFADDDK